MPSRTNTHAIETRSCDLCRIIINSYFENGDALVRELTGKDYGVDFLLELFSNGFPTGNIAFLQIKGTVQDIDENKSYVFCPGVTDRKSVV